MAFVITPVEPVKEDYDPHYRCDRIVWPTKSKKCEEEVLKLFQRAVGGNIEAVWGFDEDSYIHAYVNEEGTYKCKRQNVCGCTILEALGCDGQSLQASVCEFLHGPMVICGHDKHDDDVPLTDAQLGILQKAYDLVTNPAYNDEPLFTKAELEIVLKKKSAAVVAEESTSAAVEEIAIPAVKKMKK